MQPGRERAAGEHRPAASAAHQHSVAHTHEVPVALCQVQVFAVHTYAVTEFTILAMMSYDRYVAVCRPLSYHSIMSQKMRKLVVFVLIYPVLALGMLFIYTFQLPLCGRTIQKLYCVNYLLVKLACINTFIAKVIGLISVALYIVPQLIIIFYSYGFILKICITTFSKSRFKALRTCTPLLSVIVNYSIGCLLEVAQGQLDGRHMSYHTMLFLSLYFLILSPLMNPVIYGLSMRIVRVRLFRLLSGKKGACCVDAIRRGDAVN